MLVSELIEQLQLVPQDYKVELNVKGKADNRYSSREEQEFSTQHIDIEQSGTLFYTIYLGNWNEEL